MDDGEAMPNKASVAELRDLPSHSKVLNFIWRSVVICLMTSLQIPLGGWLNPMHSMSFNQVRSIHGVLCTPFSFCTLSKEPR